MHLLHKVPDTPSYSRTLHKVHLNDPHKILFANTALEPGATQLYQLVNENFPEISTSVIPRKYFSDDVGKNRVGWMMAWIDHIYTKGSL